MKYRISSAIGAFALFLAMAASCLAQPIFFGNTRNSTFGLEIRRPNFDSDFVSGTDIFFNFDARVSDRVKLLFELPITFYHRDAVGPFVEDNSETSFGNLFFGVRTMPVSAPTYFEGGLRMPTSPDNEYSSLFGGMLSDYPRLDAFMPDFVVLKGALGYKSPNTRGLAGRFKIGPSIWLETSESTDENELALNYSGDLIYFSEAVNFGGGLSGITFLTEDNDNTEMLLDLSLSFNSDRIRPGIELHFPLTDNLDDFVEYIVGLGLEVQFK